MATGTQDVRREIGLLLTLFLIFLPAFPVMAGPYAPAAGQPGSTAIFMSSASFVAWAAGYVNYIPGTHVDAEWQTPAKALGEAVGDSYDICCLGRGGQITLTFTQPISDGQGWDFAVFENSFSDTFLELGYVEVSADGSTFHRFNSISLTSDPVGEYGHVDPTNVTGVGGKYRQGYGVPFDLADVPISTATHVRIRDIVGDGTYRDSNGNIIYDPYPTSGSAGLDLDAIGVIHQGAISHAPTVQTHNASNIAATSAVLNGTVNPNGSSTSCRFQYGVSTAYGSNTGTQSIGQGTSTVSVNAQITGLGQNMRYHFRIVAWNSAGTSYGNNRTFIPPSNTIYVIPPGDTGNCGGRVPCESSIEAAVDYAMNTSPGQQVTINAAAGTYNDGINAANPEGKIVTVEGGWKSDFSGLSSAQTVMKGGVKTTGGRFVVKRTTIRPP